jgi:hypothetical protein
MKSISLVFLFSYLLVLLNCATPKPVILTGNESMEEKIKIYGNEKIFKGTFFSSHKYKGDVIGDLSEIMSAPYASTFTKEKWSKRNIWYYIAAVPAFAGGYMMGYGFTSGNSTLGLAGAGTALIGIGLGAISYSYESDAVDSYNKDLRKTLGIENEMSRNKSYRLMFTFSY